MSKEFGGWKDISLEDLSSMGERGIFGGSIEAQEPNSRREYTFYFSPEEDKPAQLRIHTKERNKYLKKGTEEESQEELKTVAKEIRKRTGGYYIIHPHYGLVWGTKMSPLNPNISKWQQDDDDLAIILSLSDLGMTFDPVMTDLHTETGGKADISKPEGYPMLEYLEQLKDGNPNQHNRDIAILNGRQEKWDEVFQESNGGENVPAIDLTPKSVVDLVRSLEEARVLKFSDKAHVSIRLDPPAVPAGFRNL